MKKTTSIKENWVFRSAYKRGKTAARKTMAVYILKNRLKTKNRLGLTVSTKLGGAVVRNRVRRRMKECYRLHEQAIAAGYDIVIVARHGAIDARFDTLERDLLAICRELRCLNLPKEGADG